MHGSRFRNDFDAVNHKGRRFTSDVGVEDIFPTHQSLRRRKLFVKSTLGLDQPQNAPFAEDRNFQRWFLPHLQRQVTPDTLYTFWTRVVVENPEVLLWTIV